MKPKAAEKQNIGNKNGGFSLVEVIVSMLIISILIIPIMHTFVFSARTTAQSARQEAATSLAQSVMEEILSAGILAWAEKNEYISTRQQGNFEFNVKVESEPVEYTSMSAIASGKKGIVSDEDIAKGEWTNPTLWNEYQLPDVSKLEQKTSALIDPFAIFAQYILQPDGTEKVEFVNTYDYIALNGFIEEHQNRIMRPYSNYVASLEEGEEYPPLPEVMSEDALKHLIKREMQITLEKSVAGEITVNCNISYKIETSTRRDYHYGTNYNALNHYYSTNPLPNGAAPEPIILETAFKDVEFEELNDVFLFHVPFENDWGSTYADDKITLDVTQGIDINFILASQLETYAGGKFIDFQKKGIGSAKLFLLSNSNYNKALYSPVKGIPKYQIPASVSSTDSLTERFTKENRLYEITVTITDNDHNEMIKLMMEGR